MIESDRNHLISTLPKWFWRCVIEIVENTDEIEVKAMAHDFNQNEPDMFVKILQKIKHELK